MVQPSNPGVRDYSGRYFSARFRGTAERCVLVDREIDIRLMRESKG